VNQFEKLVTALKDALGSSGLTSEDIDIKLLNRLMQDYRSNEDEWRRFALVDPNSGYTRNLVDQGNGKSNLLLLVWAPGKGSLIHSHSNAHCLMKILYGQLTETRYEFPGKANSPEDHASMTTISEKVHVEDQVAYMNDDLGVHKMWNNGIDYAVSLHLYTPPNIVRHGCFIFDEATGERTHVQTFENFSFRGKR
ncbi:hypothetical protein COCC4DRAFT_92910, partial [Bipolaris maydis ATCC 48331]